MTAAERNEDGRARADVAVPWFAGATGRRIGRWGTALLAVSIPLFALGGLGRGAVPADRVSLTLVVSAVVGVSLVWRSRAPLVVLAVALGGLVATTAAGSTAPWLMFAVEVAVVSAAATRPWTESAPAALVSAIVLFAIARESVEGPVTEPRALIVVAWTGLALAAGLVVRTQRAYVRALADRARRADETREQVARARVAEERVRIARELHDVVAHHIAVINLHAGLARAAQGRDAAVVDSSLGHVQDAASTVLAELGTVLRVLRAPEERDDTDGPRPVPGLAAIDELVATVAAAGLVVRRTTTGRPRPMDQASELTAFRVVQESLTNATRYGTGTADLMIEYGGSALRVTVVNPVVADGHRDPASAGSAGQGLTGMRERVEGCGGSLTAGPDGPRRFRVTALVPYALGPDQTEDAPGRGAGGLR